MTANAESIIGLYDRHATEFDRQRGRSLFEKSWIDRFLSTIPAAGAILDLGCGMAEPIARYIVGRGYHVTGVDSSPKMIELCTARFPEQKWLIADMRQISLNQQFDGILAWDSFFHLTPDDQRLMFPVFDGHASPGAMLMFTSGPRFGEALGTFEGEPLYHASLDPDEYQTLLIASGFEVVAYKAEDKACAGHTAWLAKLRGGG